MSANDFPGSILLPGTNRLVGNESKRVWNLSEKEGIPYPDVPSGEGHFGINRSRWMANFSGFNFTFPPPVPSTPTKT